MRRAIVAAATCAAVLSLTAGPVREAVASDGAHPVGVLQEATDGRTAAVARASRAAGNRLLGRMLARERGWTGREWRCLDVLWGRESHWDDRAANRKSAAYGIPQNITGGSPKYRAYASEQIRWGLDYIVGRYRLPCVALQHSNRWGWY